MREKVRDSWALSRAEQDNGQDYGAQRISFTQRCRVEQFKTATEYLKAIIEAMNYRVGNGTPYDRNL